MKLTILSLQRPVLCPSQTRPCRWSQPRTLTLPASTSQGSRRQKRLEVLSPPGPREGRRNHRVWPSHGLQPPEETDPLGGLHSELLGSRSLWFSVLHSDLSPPCQLSSRKTQILTWVQTLAIISTPSSITSSASSPAPWTQLCFPNSTCQSVSCYIMFLVSAK